MTGKPYRLESNSSSLGELPSEGISPSNIATIGRCALQGALALLREQPKLSFSIDAALGTAIHKFLEAANQGLYDDVDLTSLEVALEKQVTAQAELVGRRWYEKGQLPLSRARDSAVKKKNAVRLAKFQVESHRKVGTSPQRPVPGGANSATVGASGPVFEINDRVEVEKRLATEDGFLVGRADVFYWDDDGNPVIEDWKTGEVLDEEGALKKDIEGQLMLYGVMVYEATQKVPVLRVRALRREPFEVACTAETLMQHRENAESQFLEIKNLLSGLTPDQDPYLELARPGDSSTACRFCVYRPVCPGYLGQLYKTLHEFGSWDCLGKILNLETQGNGARLVTLKHPGLEEEHAVSFKKSSIDRHPALDEIMVGDTIGVFNVSFSWPRNVYEDRRSTLVYVYGYDPFRECFPNGAAC